MAQTKQTTMGTLPMEKAFDPTALLGWSLGSELSNALQHGEFDIYVERAEGESQIWLLGEACNWDRETLIQHCLAGVSGHLGRAVFEKSYDSGNMKAHAKTYHDALRNYRANA
jgi:hypothetical protein